jgi:hypothetical protein
MGEAIKALEDPTLRLVAIMLLVVVITVVVTASLQGRQVSFFPPSIGQKLPGSQWIIQSGKMNIPDGHPKRAEFREGSYKGIKTIVIPITFDTPYKKPPRVVVSLQKIDLGNPVGPTINRLEVYADSVGLKGFDLTFKTWEDSKVFDAAASWIAFGE